MFFVTAFYAAVVTCVCRYLLGMGTAASIAIGLVGMFPLTWLTAWVIGRVSNRPRSPDDDDRES